MMALWIELTIALVAAAAIGFWTGWRIRGADVARADAETKHLRDLWMQMAEAEGDGSTPAPVLHAVAEKGDEDDPPARRAAG